MVAIVMMVSLLELESQSGLVEFAGMRRTHKDRLEEAVFVAVRRLEAA